MLNEINCWFLMRRGHQSTQQVTPRSRVKNQQTQPMYEVEPKTFPKSNRAQHIPKILLVHGPLKFNWIIVHVITVSRKNMCKHSSSQLSVCLQHQLLQ